MIPIESPDWRKSHPPPGRVVAHRLHHFQRHFRVCNSAEPLSIKFNLEVGGMLRCLLDERDDLGPLKMTGFDGTITRHFQIGRIVAFEPDNLPPAAKSRPQR